MPKSCRVLEPQDSHVNGFRGHLHQSLQVLCCRYRQSTRLAGSDGTLSYCADRGIYEIEVCCFDFG